jgi:hypothetical protein
MLLALINFNSKSIEFADLIIFQTQTKHQWRFDGQPKKK